MTDVSPLILEASSATNDHCFLDQVQHFKYENVGKFYENFSAMENSKTIESLDKQKS